MDLSNFCTEATHFFEVNGAMPHDIEEWDPAIDLDILRNGNTRDNVENLEVGGLLMFWWGGTIGWHPGYIGCLFCSPISVKKFDLN